MTRTVSKSGRKNVAAWLKSISAKGGLGAQSEARAKTVRVTLPSSLGFYNGQPVTYQAGRLYVGEECVRERR